MKKFALLYASLLLVAFGAGPAGAGHVACGDTISVNTTLDKNIGPCAGDGLTVMGGVTLDLNHKRIRGSGAGGPFTVGISVEGAGVTVINGSVQDFPLGVYIRPEGHDAMIDGVTVKKTKYGIAVVEADDVIIRNTKIINAISDGLEGIYSDNLLFENSKITNVGRGTQYQSSDPDGDPCGAGNGMFIFGSDGVRILNNKINQVGQSGILYWANDNGLIDGNEVSSTSSRPCVLWSTDFGAITIIAGSTNTVVSNNVVTDNDDAAIGLYGSVDTSIVNNFLARNTSGIFFIAGDTGTIINDNCIFDTDTGDGLIISDLPIYTVDAKYNYWGAADGPGGDGPLGATLTGSGELIVQKVADIVTVIPYLEECHLSEADE